MTKSSNFKDHMTIEGKLVWNDLKEILTSMKNCISLAYRADSNQDFLFKSHLNKLEKLIDTF